MIYNLGVFKKLTIQTIILFITMPVIGISSIGLYEGITNSSIGVVGYILKIIYIICFLPEYLFPKFFADGNYFFGHVYIGRIITVHFIYSYLLVSLFFFKN